MLFDGQASLPELVEFFEKTLITQALDSWTSTNSELAKQLSLTRRTFYNKLQKYAIAQPSSS
jgi:DNA-binding NtrC family response regulator